MIRYKHTYKVVDNGSKENKQDTYIQCVPLKSNIQIYRYNNTKLVVQFNSLGIANNRIKELSELGIELIPFQIGDNERTYIFNESDLTQVAEVVKARKRIKRDLTDEQREELSIRMKNIIHSKNDIK